MTDLRTHRNVNSGQVGTKKARITKAPLGSHEWRTQFLQIPRGCRKVIHDWAEVMPLLQVQHPKVGSSYLWLREGRTSIACLLVWALYIRKQVPSGGTTPTDVLPYSLES